MPLNWPLAFYVSCDDSLFIKLAISTFISQFKYPASHTHAHTETQAHTRDYWTPPRGREREREGESHVRNEYMNPSLTASVEIYVRMVRLHSALSTVHSIHSLHSVIWSDCVCAAN